jgi:hypothetical protein
VLARLEALETGLARPQTVDRPPSTVDPGTVARPPGHVGIRTTQTFGPVDDLCASGAEARDSTPGLSAPTAAERLLAGAALASAEKFVMRSLEYPRMTSTDLNDLTCKIVGETDPRPEPPDPRVPSKAPEAQDPAGPLQSIWHGWNRASAAWRCSSRTDDGIR